MVCSDDFSFHYKPIGDALAGVSLAERYGGLRVPDRGDGMKSPQMP
ncbi:hypothetical protein [Microcoleus sp. K5-D4]